MDEVSNKRLTSMAQDIANGLAYLADIKYVHRYILEISLYLYLRLGTVLWIKSVG